MGAQSGHLGPLTHPLVKQGLACPILIPRLLLPHGLSTPDRLLPHFTGGKTEVLKPVVTKTPAKTEAWDAFLSCRDFALVPREGTQALGAVWGNGGSVFPPSQQVPLLRAVRAPGVPTDSPPTFLIPAQFHGSPGRHPNVLAWWEGLSPPRGWPQQRARRRQEPRSCGPGQPAQTCGQPLAP